MTTVRVIVVVIARSSLAVLWTPFPAVGRLEFIRASSGFCSAALRSTTLSGVATVDLPFVRLIALWG